MNVLFILSDQHNPFFSGFMRHPLAETPNIDRIARNGTAFHNAYCVSPFCVPTRAALFTGRYAHEIPSWCNSTPWDAGLRGWSHHFRETGIHLATVGKLDFADVPDHGIEEELLGGNRKSFDVHSLFREQPVVPRWLELKQIAQSGPRSDLTEDSFHDHEVEVRSVEWIKHGRPQNKPWVLNVNFTAPHPGWPCPPPLWDKWNARVKLEDLQEKYFQPLDRLHPYHRLLSRHTCGEFTSNEDLRRCHAAYLAHIEMVDRRIGRLLDVMDNEGILDDTLVIYASDHGEMCGAHRIWGKMVMYEDSIRVPLVFMGPGVRKGRAVKSPVSHLDIFPSIAEAVGAAHPADFRGISLLGLCSGKKGAPKNDFVLTEFHGNGFPGGVFAVNDGRYKFVECVGERPILFDLKNDPQELRDLAVEKPDDAVTRKAISRARNWLCSVCSPQAVDLRAKKDQRILRAELEKSGRLVKEVEKRGYLPRTDVLIPRPDVVPPAFNPDGSPA